MIEKQSIVKLTPPIEVNGEIALFQLIYERYIIDTTTRAEVLQQQIVTNLFGQTKEQVRADFAQNLAQVQQQETQSQTEFTSRIDQANKVIADIDAL